MKAIKIDIQGKVQGVYFRAQTCIKAKELSINGRVKNMPDGSVQIIAEGDVEKLVHLVNWCQRGPMLAKVSSVKTEEIEWKGFTDFAAAR